MIKSVYHKDIYKFLRICFYIMQLLVLFSLQQVPDFLPEIYGGRPTLILPLLLTVSLQEGNYFALIWGLVCGLLMDMNPSRFVGIQIFVMGVVGYLLGRLKDRGYKVNLKTFLVLSVFIEPIMILMRFCLNYNLPKMHYIDAIVNRHIIPCILYTVLVSPFVYLFNRSVLFSMAQKGGDEN